MCPQVTIGSVSPHCILAADASFGATAMAKTPSRPEARRKAFEGSRRIALTKADSAKWSQFLQALETVAAISQWLLAELVDSLWSDLDAPRTSRSDSGLLEMAMTAMTAPKRLRARPRDFPVVCVGGSAGGPDAYTRHLRYLPCDLGVAVVVVNHLRHTATLLRKLLPRSVPRAPDERGKVHDYAYAFPHRI